MPLVTWCLPKYYKDKEADKDFRKAKETLMSLNIVNMLDTNIALQSAENFRTLRKKGITVRKTIDAIIATYCIENKLPLLHFR